MANAKKMQLLLERQYPGRNHFQFSKNCKIDHEEEIFVVGEEYEVKNILARHMHRNIKMYICCKSYLKWISVIKV